MIIIRYYKLMLLKDYLPLQIPKCLLVYLILDVVLAGFL